MRTTLVSVVCAALLAGSPVHAQSAARDTIPQAELVRRLSSALDSLSSAGSFSGVVVLARNGAPVLERAYGMADREAGRANAVDTRFNLGSINKVFTATAIRQLAAQGQVNLDSTLAAYLPDYPNQEVARRVTLRQLMEHRAGMGGNVFGIPASGSRMTLRHNRDFLPLFAGEALQFEPGSANRYCNVCYVVLGSVVERVSGQDYYDYIRQNVYRPAGMSSTGHYALDSLPANTAVGYTMGEDRAGPLRRNDDLLPGRGSSAGGGYSTAHDLLRFVAALRGGRIPGGPPAGLGVAGGSPGVNATLEGGLPGGYDLVVLANLDPRAAGRVGELLRGWMGIAED
ncbi:MAG TPA: serine hydrolase domain-containing protein [Longimicrobium sp.]|nr:serine hydrolase domain-containing protein [Longimicrobium sp.]